MDGLPAIGAVGSVGTMVLMSGLIIYKFLKHSSCRSKCLGGNETSIQVDLEEKTVSDSIKQ
jgi:hypothetical protein